MDLFLKCQMVACLTFISISFCFGAKLKLYQQNYRASGVLRAITVRSLAECAAMFQADPSSLSLNYEESDNVCELSENSPEFSGTTEGGWKVYGPIVDGEWSAWTNWDSCTVTCRDGTRSRSRLCNNPSASNGGETCAGDSTENTICTNAPCISDYDVSSYQTRWGNAKMACEGMSARLVIIDNQIEFDFLDGMIPGLNHWIGMECNGGTNCKWIDGTALGNGFSAWAQGEPSSTYCVWMGYFGNKWDDDFCSSQRYFICEYQ